MNIFCLFSHIHQRKLSHFIAFQHIYSLTLTLHFSLFTLHWKRPAHLFSVQTFTVIIKPVRAMMIATIHFRVRWREEG